jgi:hypothetical protein
MRRFILGAIFFAMVGTTTAEEPHNRTDNHDLDYERKELLRIADSLERSLKELQKLEAAKAIQSGLQTEWPKPPQGGAMGQIVNFPDFEGSLESFLKAIANQYKYKLQVTGSKPPTDIIVFIATQNKTLGEIIEDADVQAGIRVHIIVEETPERIIKLRYVSEAI